MSIGSKQHLELRIEIYLCNYYVQSWSWVGLIKSLQGFICESIQHQDNIVATFKSHLKLGKYEWKGDVST